MHSIFVVLLDGLADRAHDSLGGRTANEAADTPNLDRFAAGGSCGLIYGVGPGRAPSSEIAHWAMLGYAPEEFPGRAVFEALGAGQEIDPDDVLAFAALRPAERREDGLWLRGRPRKSGEDEDDVAELVAACAELELDGFRFALDHFRRGEAALRVSPGADDRVTDTDAFFKDRYPVLRPQAQVPEAEATALAAEAWTRRTIEALDAELGALPTDRAIVCVTGDHATPAYPEVIHSGDPVPFLVSGPGVRADAVERFGELNCAAGILGQLRGPDMMPVLLNAADRPLFLGSRPTPFPGADGYPELLEPLL